MKEIKLQITTLIIFSYVVIPAMSLAADQLVLDRAQQIKESTGIDIGTYQQAAEEEKARQQVAAQEPGFGIGDWLARNVFIPFEDFVARPAGRYLKNFGTSVKNLYSNARSAGYIPFTKEYRMRSEANKIRSEEQQRFAEELKKPVPKLEGNPFNFKILPPGITEEGFREVVARPSLFLDSPVVKKCKSSLVTCSVCSGFTKEDILSLNVPGICQECVLNNYVNYQACLKSSGKEQTAPVSPVKSPIPGEDLKSDLPGVDVPKQPVKPIPEEDFEPGVSF